MKIGSRSFVPRNKSVVIAFILLFTAPLLWAQTNNYRFKHLSTNDGLSQSSVIAIEQDKMGQMWLGTRDGLNKYNGTSFKIYRNDPKDSLSLSNSDILSLEEDKNGNIWVGTYNGLNRYDPIKNTFKRYFHSKDPRSLANNAVWCIVEMQDGEIWIGTAKGVSIYEPETDDFFNILDTPNNTPRLNESYVLSILQTDRETIWLGTSNGLFECTGSALENRSVKKIDLNGDRANLRIQDIIAFNEHTLYIATKNNGLLRFDTLSKKIVQFDDNNIPEKINKDIRALELDKNGALWLGTYHGINIIDSNGKVDKIINQPGNPSSLSQDFIKSLYTDAKGSVWIGSYYGGVDIWDSSNVNFINYSQGPGTNGLGNKVVSSVVANAKKDIYFGTEGGGITVFGHDGEYTEYLNISNTKDLPSNNIKSLALEDNKLWIGSFNAELVVYDIENKKFDKQIISEALKTYLSGTGVYSIKKEHDGVFWLGTFGKGLVNYDHKSKKYRVFKNIPFNKNSISSDRIRCILIDKSFNIWAGTQNGLNRIAQDTGNYTVKRFFFDEDALSGEDIQTIFQDKDGTIWVGIKAKGLFRFNGNKFEGVLLDSENAITSIYSILQDERNTLWLSSNHGLINYDPALQKSIIYDQKDGLIGNEFSSGACLKVQGSRFYFGGPSGVSSFDPENFSTNEYSPQVILSDFKIKNRSIVPNSDQNILEKSISYTESITLAHDMANFSIEYAIPNFISASRNKYSYRLLGLEEEWNTTSKTQADYTIQKAGNYTFEVKGANNDGKWNDHPTTLNIEVEPAPWKSGWAFALYTLLIGLSLIGLTWIIKSKTKLRHQLELEHIQSQRNEEIHDAKLRFFTNISHEFRTPLTLISGPLQQLLGDYRGSSFMYKKLLVIESNANHLLQLINRLMDFRKLENKQFKLEAAQGNIVKFLKEIFLSFDEFAKTGDYTYSFSASHEEILVYYDRTKLEQVFYNLISNAFKYTPNKGIVEIRIDKNENEITVAVNDSGVGIPKEYNKQIFDRFFEIPKGPETTGNGKGTGIGLSIAKNIVQLHKGNIAHKNKKTSGSSFVVKLPLGRDHLSEDEIIEDFKFSDDLAQYESQLEKVGSVPGNDLNDLTVNENKLTILVVEDNKPLRSFIKNLLRKNYNIIQAGNGKEALKKALKHVPDLIISDVIMPVMVGTELCSNIKNNIKTSHIPVILLTSRTSLIYKFEGLESGADDYISKPFNIKEFKLRIKNLLESNQRLKDKFSGDYQVSSSDLTVSSLDSKLLKKAFQIVEDNISNEQFDIASFSFDLGVSRTMLFAKIKAWTNLTPNEFIHELRMKRAAQLLEDDRLNISQISYKVGFRNPKYFSKCFQKKFGESPSRFAQKFSKDFTD